MWGGIFESSNGGDESSLIFPVDLRHGVRKLFFLKMLMIIGDLVVVERVGGKLWR